MSEPTATRGSDRYAGSFKTRFHAPPVKLKTAQRWTGKQTGKKKAMTIASLPGPVNDPHSI
jgi:hypothetical protein